jgi:hypothetical protein
MTFRWLLRSAEWLDKRFPPKVTVTDEVFEALQAKEHRHSKEIATLSGEVMVVKSELRAAEKSLAALKDFIAKGGAGGISDVQRRARFIAEGRMPEPTATEGA